MSFGRRATPAVNVVAVLKKHNLVKLPTELCFRQQFAIQGAHPEWDCGDHSPLGPGYHL
jgi:hypothetical protein